MPTSVDLSGCWSKLHHANEHLNALRFDIAKACDSDFYTIPVIRRYEPAEKAVIYRIGDIVQIPDDWPLMVGDAIHDMRSALDHLMYQLAIAFLGRKPKESECHNIQFPAIKRLKDFNKHRFLKYVRPDDIAKLKPFQPYKRLKKGALHPLPKLVRLSNTDKHRELHLMVVIPVRESFTNRSDAFRDCVPDPTVPNPPGHPTAIAYHGGLARSPHKGDEILRVRVRPIGPNPDVEFDMKLTGYIGVDRLGPVVRMLEAMAKYVGNVLEAYQ